MRLVLVLGALLWHWTLAVRPSGRDDEVLEHQVKRIMQHSHANKCDEATKAPDVVENACPETCPFAAEMMDPSMYCQFKCVKAQECGTKGTMKNQTIPQKEKKGGNPYCRYCEVEACAKCVASRPGDTSETVETCEKCMPGYTLIDDGKECKTHGDLVFVGLAGFIGVVAIMGVIWLGLLQSKPTVNEEGLQYGLQSQLRMMVTQDHHGDEGQPYPFGTNLLSVHVAGPGGTALFRFQAAAIAWAVLVIAVWLGFVIFVEHDLLRLGNRPAVTPMQLCEVVAWGRKLQMKLIWTKVTWIAVAYLLGTFGAIFYGIMMAKFFRAFDSERATLSDYVAVIENVPIMKGEEKVEDILKEAVQAAVGSDVANEVVAVSVGWNFHAYRAQVRHFIDEEVSKFHEDNGEPLAIPEGSGDEFTGMAGAITKKILQRWHIHLDGHGEEFTTADLTKNLQGMETSPVSYVIFMTESARDKAVEAAQASGITVKDATCSLRPETYEPEALLWHNLQVTDNDRRWKFTVSSANIFLTCMAWTVLLYLPYAHYMSAFSYANGDEPSQLAESVFIGLVVGSQIGLFVASSIGTEFCQCHYEDQKHKVYIIFYNAALILNLIMDIVLQGYLSYLQMVGVGARVADGRQLGILSSLQEIFESYPMQKSVGKLLFKYCWPCTFLVPFIAEPFLAQLGPFHVGTLLLRSNARIRGENAERALELSEMEQGRYADVIFNLILVACIPFLAPAYMLMTYAAFLFSHLVIYLYDHWKTLRWARKFYFSSDEVHWFGQQLLSLPLGILASALVFKANQMSGGATGGLGSGELKGSSLFAAMAAACALHVLVHLTVLDMLVKPYRIDPNKAENTTPFSKVAEEEAATHLTTNPVQCLRSKFLHKDSPPLSPFVLGKEKTMKPNPKLGAYFDGIEDAAQKAKFREEKRKSQESKASAAKEVVTDVEEKA